MKIYVTAIIAFILWVSIDSSYAQQCINSCPKLSALLQQVKEKVAQLEELSTWYQASNGLLYKVFTDKATYSEAKSNCMKYGATLATVGVRDSLVYSELKTLVDDSGAYRPFVGLSDHVIEGRWAWDDGVPLRSGEVDWSRGQPDDFKGVQDCAGFSRPFNFKFDDYECYRKEAYICEISV